MAGANGRGDALAHMNKVVRSVNAPGEQRCVDIFRDAQGRFGYAEYRRDPEDGSGWYPTGVAKDPVFTLQAEAEHAAAASIPWFAEFG